MFVSNIKTFITIVLLQNQTVRDLSASRWPGELQPREKKSQISSERSWRIFCPSKDIPGRTELCWLAPRGRYIQLKKKKRLKSFWVTKCGAEEHKREPARGTQSWRVSFGLDKCEADKENANCARMMLSSDVARENQEPRARAWSSSCGRRDREAASRGLAGMDLVLTRERGCVGAGVRQQWWRKCWNAAFGSSEGFWLLKTSVKALLGCMLEADQWSSSSFANMVQSEFLLLQPRLLVLLPKAHSTVCRNPCAERRGFSTNKTSPKVSNLFSSSPLLLTFRLWFWKDSSKIQNHTQGFLNVTLMWFSRLPEEPFHRVKPRRRIHTLWDCITLGMQKNNCF